MLDLANLLTLSPADGMEIELRSDLNDKIIEAIEAKHLTHAQVAKLAQTSNRPNAKRVYLCLSPSAVHDHLGISDFFEHGCQGWKCLGIVISL